MYEELYESIPDPDAYLRRLRMPRPGALNREYLNRLVYAHQRYVVFENLDPFVYHRPVSLGIWDTRLTAAWPGFCGIKISSRRYFTGGS